MFGAGTVYLPPAKAKAGPVMLVVPGGWLKAVAKPPGVQLRTPLLELTAAEAIMVMHVTKTAVDFFVESGDGKNGRSRGDRRRRTARTKRSAANTWPRPAPAPSRRCARAPKAFVDGMPRHFHRSVPVFAARLKSPPALVVDHEITYAEAEPWLAGPRPRGVRAAVCEPPARSGVSQRREPNPARYPTWDRILHPEKYAAQEHVAKKAESSDAAVRQRK